MKKFTAVMAAMLVGGVAMAAEMYPVTSDMQGRYPGATHVIELKAGTTFDGLATNAALASYYLVPAGSTVRFVAYECQIPFLGVYSTNQSLYDATVSMGISNSATAFMTAQQCGTNTTVWWKYGVPTVTDTPTLTITRSTITNVVGETTNVIQLVSNVTATVSAAVAHGTAYSSATYLMATVTPAADQSLDWATQGKIRLFMDVRQPYGK